MVAIIPIEKENQSAIKTVPTIPLVLRNKTTGYPLMQLGFYYYEPSKGYTPAIGGGKCHDMNLPLYGLAILISQLTPYPKISSRDDKAMTVSSFMQIKEALKGYHLNVPRFGISISEKHTAYGYLFKIQLPEEKESQEFTQRWYAKDIFNLFLKDTDAIGMWKDVFYSEEHINHHLDHDSAVFYQGQVYVDLGELLKKINASDYVKQFFKEIFKVEAWRNLIAAENKPTSTSDCLRLTR